MSSIVLIDELSQPNRLLTAFVTFAKPSQQTKSPNSVSDALSGRRLRMPSWLAVSTRTVFAASFDFADELYAFSLAELSRTTKNFLKALSMALLMTSRRFARTFDLLFSSLKYSIELFINRTLSEFFNSQIFMISNFKIIFIFQ